MSSPEEQPWKAGERLRFRVAAIWTQEQTRYLQRNKDGSLITDPRLSIREISCV